MKQTEQDPRINASSLTFSDYLKILLICNVTCALLLAVYNLMHGFLHAKFQDDHDLVVYISVGISSYWQASSFLSSSFMRDGAI